MNVWSQSWLIWCGAVVIALPLLSIFLAEVETNLDRRHSSMTKPLHVFRTSVLPLAALVVLLAVIPDDIVGSGSNWFKIAATGLGLLLLTFTETNESTFAKQDSPALVMATRQTVADAIPGQLRGSRPRVASRGVGSYSTSFALGSFAAAAEAREQFQLRIWYTARATRRPARQEIGQDIDHRHQQLADAVDNADRSLGAKSTTSVDSSPTTHNGVPR